MELPVRITPKALDKIRELQKSLQLGPEQFLRIGVKGGVGCAGMQHLIGFDQQEEKDEVFQAEEINVLIRKGQSMYLLGMEIDYVEEEPSKGFVFR